MHIYEVRPRKDHRGVDLISDVLPFGLLWYDTPDNAIGYATMIPFKFAVKGFTTNDHRASAYN